MNQQQFEMVAPEINSLTVIKGCVFRVTYHNPGKRRFTSEAVAIVKKPDIQKGSAEALPNVIMLLATGEEFTQKEFEDYRRRTWPLKHEKERNADNPTLGVQPGVMGAKGGM